MASQSEQFISALGQYQQLTALIESQLDALPISFQTQFATWKSTADPILDQLPQQTTDISGANLTTLLIKQRLKPHELQRLKNQTSLTQEQQTLEVINKTVQDVLLNTPNLTFSLPLSKNNNPLNSNVIVKDLDWNNLNIKKSKMLKDKVVFAMAGFMRVANLYLRSNPLYQLDDEDNDNNNHNTVMSNDDENGVIVNKPITAQTLATLWVSEFLPILQTQFLKIQQEAQFETGNIVKFITVELPTVSERLGNIDFYFDLKAYKNAIEKDGRDEKSEQSEKSEKSEKSDNFSHKKRKELPISTSPTLSATLSKPKPNNNNNHDNDNTESDDSSSQELVQLGEDKVYQEIAGLFDFAPTTGESRHCINPDTTDLLQFQFTSMGYINSCYRAKFSTPRQGNAAPSSHASLTIHNDVRFHSLLGLEQYSHVWLLFVFHSNAQGSYRPKITPPRLGERVGCLATRSPHRWNDIGLSLVKLDKIEYPENFQHLPLTHPSRQFYVHSPGINSKAKQLPGCARLILSNVDLIDGTPILDVKPFNPGDMIPNPQATLRLPNWLATAPSFTLDIQFHKQALKDLYSIFDNYYQTQLDLLIQRSDVFHLGIAEKDQKLSQMDKQSFLIYSRQYDMTRITKLKEHNELFKKFNSMFDIDHNNDNNNNNINNNNNNGDGGDTQPLLLTSCDQIQEYLSHELGSPLQFYPTISSIQQAIIDTLRNDPRPIWTKYENRNRAIFGFLYDNLNIVYQMNGEKEATVCFLQLREEYLQLCEQIKSQQQQQQQKSNPTRPPELTSKQRGWMQLIKEKITKTTINPTDDWAKHVHESVQGKL
jgi:tRNA (Thr-GGU) A37 N-methylase